MEEGGRLWRGYGKYIQRRDERHPGVLGPVSLLRGKKAFLLLDSVAGCLRREAALKGGQRVLTGDGIQSITQLCPNLSTPWTAAHQTFHHHLPEFAQTHVL